MLFFDPINGFLPVWQPQKTPISFFYDLLGFSFRHLTQFVDNNCTLWSQLIKSTNVYYFDPVRRLNGRFKIVPKNKRNDLKYLVKGMIYDKNYPSLGLLISGIDLITVNLDQRAVSSKRIMLGLQQEFKGPHKKSYQKVKFSELTHGLFDYSHKHLILVFKNSLEKQSDFAWLCIFDLDCLRRKVSVTDGLLVKSYKVGGEGGSDIYTYGHSGFTADRRSLLVITAPSYWGRNIFEISLDKRNRSSYLEIVNNFEFDLPACSNPIALDHGYILLRASYNCVVVFRLDYEKEAIIVEGLEKQFHVSGKRLSNYLESLHFCCFLRF